MSPERPPSQDSGGGGISAIESGNMVLSTIPTLESGHVIIQHHQQQQQHQHRITTSHQGISNGVTNYTHIHRGTPPNNTLKPVISAHNISPSKYVFFQQNGTVQHAAGEPTTTYITGAQSNNVGNIVLVTTESMDINTPDQINSMNSNGTDEELTSLTWLHDKNLIKGIVACTNKSAETSPVRQSNGGALSPTSDFLEDSCVSEDNASSANSTSDQGISVHNADFSPTGNQNGNSFTMHHHHHHIQQGQYQSGHHQIQYINNNNNNCLNKNRNHIISPSTTAVTNGITTFASPLSQDQLMGATTTVHVGPSGTTTVVEYKTGSNFIASPRTHINQVPASPQRTPPSNSVLITSSLPSPNQPSSSSNTSTTSAHQHFHKKYIREQLNGFDQGIQQNNVQSTPSTNHPISTFTFNQQTSTIPESKEFVHSTPIKQSSLSVPYGTTNGHDDTTKEDITPQEAQNGRVSAIQKPIASPKQKHPTNVPYDPLVHTHNKPPYSFSSLIFMAIEDSPEKALPVKEIYAWIVQHFPYFKTAPTGWKNSVRHNLSLNKSFLKVEKAPNMGKGSLWRVEQQQRPNLIQALTRSPFFPCSVVDKIAPQKSPSTPQPADSPPPTSTKSTLDARLFPKLSKMIKEMVTKGNGTEFNSETNEIYQKVSCNSTGINIANGGSVIMNGGVSDNQFNTNGINGISNNSAIQNNISHYENIEKLARDCGAESIDDVNAATAMLALKHGPKVFSETFHNGSPVITSSPSEDHTYSAGGSGGSSNSGGGSICNSSGNHSRCGSDNNSTGALSDAAYESSEEGHGHQITPEELEARRRHIEGVDALLSFASKVSSMSSSAASSPIKRPASPSFSDEHISSYMENIQNSITNGGTIIISDNHNNNNNNISIRDDDANNHQRSNFLTQNSFYYNNVLSPSPAKKLKPSKNLRAKIKRKATWIR